MNVLLIIKNCYLKIHVSNQTDKVYIISGIWTFYLLSSIEGLGNDVVGSGVVVVGSGVVVVGSGVVVVGSGVVVVGFGVVVVGFWVVVVGSVKCKMPDV